MSNGNQTDLQVSVVMATYNRAHLLPELLEAWRAVDRSTNLRYELVFSDDGSTDSTLEVLRACSDLPLVVLENPHGGAARARNHAVSVAQGEMLIFTGDDIFPEPGYLDQHYRYFQSHGDQYATLGRIDWRPGIRMTYLMKHITEIGCEQFGFVALPPHQVVDFRHFYTSNISLSAKILRQLDQVFDLSFEKCNFEDIELGYRLQKAGLLQIYYAPEIRVFHDHVYSDASKFMNRQRLAGQQLATFKHLQPDLSVFEIHHDIEGSRHLLKQIAARPRVGLPLVMLSVRRWILLTLATYFEARLSRKISGRLERYCSLVYGRLFREAFLEGLASGLEPSASRKTVQRFGYCVGTAGFAQVFFDGDNAFSEEKSFRIPVLSRVPFRLEVILPEGNWRRIRLDPYSGPVRVAKLDGRVHLADNQAHSLGFVHHNAVPKTQWDFSQTEDPLLITDLYPSGIQKIEVEGLVDVLRYPVWIRRSRFVVAKTKALARRIVRRVLSGVAPLATSLLRVTGRSIVVQVGEVQAVRRYEEVSAPFRSAVRVVGPEYRGDVDYKYCPSSIDTCLESNAFLVAVVTLATRNLDFVVIDSGFGPWPSVAGADWTSVTLFSGRFVSYEDFESNRLNSLGRCLSLCLSDGKHLDLLPVIFTGSSRGASLDLDKGSPDGSALWKTPRRGTRVAHGKPVVFILPTFMAVGGVERNTIEVMRALQHEYRFVVITWENHSREMGTLFHQVKQLALAVFPLPQMVEASSFLPMIDFLSATYQPQAVWVPNSNPWYFNHLPEIRKIFRDSVMVAQDCYDDRHGWIAHYDRPGVSSYDHFIAINLKIQEAMIGRFRLNPSKISLIYSSIHTERIMTTRLDSKFSREAVLGSFGLDPARQYFSLIGRMVDQKRPLLFVEMACRILEIHPELGFNLVGSGPLLGEVRQAIERSGRQDAFTVIPYIDNLYEFHRAMDGLVLTSEYEGLPIVSIEAMCLGVPIFSTAVGDLPFFIRKTGGGLICHNESLDGLVDGFQRFLSQLDDYRLKACASSEESIAFFSSERAAELTGRLFQRERKSLDVEA